MIAILTSEKYNRVYMVIQFKLYYIIKSKKYTMEISGDIPNLFWIRRIILQIKYLFDIHLIMCNGQPVFIDLIDSDPRLNRY